MGPSNGSGEPRALSLARLSGLASGMPPQAAACALGDPCHEARHAEFERVPPAWLRCLTEFGVSGGLKWGAELGRAPAARQAFRSQNCGQNDRWWSGCEARTDRWAQLCVNTMLGRAVWWLRTENLRATRDGSKCSGEPNERWFQVRASILLTPTTGAEAVRSIRSFLGGALAWCVSSRGAGQRPRTAPKAPLWGFCEGTKHVQLAGQVSKHLTNFDWPAACTSGYNIEVYFDYRPSVSLDTVRINGIKQFG